MKVNGRPLIVLRASGSVPLTSWQGILAGLRAERLEAAYLAIGHDAANVAVFDGLHENGVLGYAGLAGTFRAAAQATRSYSLLAPSATPRIWVAALAPCICTLHASSPSAGSDARRRAGAANPSPASG
jgi:hypothetical protein